MIELAMIAQAPLEPWMNLGGQGLMGAVLGFFMWFIGKKHTEAMKTSQQIAIAIASAAKAQMVTMLGLKNLDKSVTEMAQEVKDQLEAIEKGIRSNESPDS